MPFEQYANEAATTLAGAILAGATTITVASAVGFPASAIFRIRVDGTLTAGGSGTEYMTVTAGGVGTTVWTVVRGSEPPYATGLGFATGAAVIPVLTARSMVNGQFYDVRGYGAKLDVVSRTDGAVATGTPTAFTSAGAKFTSADVGKLIQVNGATTGGFPLSTTIAAVVSATAVTLAAGATLTVSGAAFSYGSDDTTALTAAITDVNASGGGVLYFPAGTSFTGTLTLNSRTHLLGSGVKTTVLMAKPALSAPVILSAGFASLAGTATGGGVLQCSIRNLTVDGNRASMTYPLAAPAAPTCVGSTTAGTIAAGTYSYAVSRLTGNGETKISAGSTTVTTTGTTSKVTVTFPATVTGQTGWRVRGRAWPYLTIADVGLVATYVDTGSVTPSGDPPRSNLDAGDGIRIFGYDYVIDNVVVKQAAGHGIYSEWANTDVMADPANDWMEAFVSNSKVHDNGGSGLVWNGPHDSIISNIISAFNSLASNFTYIGIHCAGNGFASLFNACHAFGNHAYSWKTEGNFFLSGCVGEGAATAQLWTDGDYLVLQGGTLFAGGTGGASSKGLQIGSAGYSPARTSATGLVLNGFATAAAVDFTFAGANTSVTAKIDQASGSAYTGTIPADAEVDLTVSGGSTTPSVQQIRGRLYGSTSGTPTVAAGSNAGTSPPAPVLVTGGTDLRGTVTFGSGSGTPAIGNYAVVTFTTGLAFPRTPIVVLTSNNAATVIKQPFVSAVSTTAFTIGLGVAAALSQANTVYSVGYHVIG